MPLFTRNVELGAPLKLSSWRKVAIGTWRSAGDPSIYGVAEIDVAPAMAFLEKVRAKTGTKVTLTHFAGKAMAATLAKHPEINCILRFGRLYPRKDVDIFFQVSADKTGKELSGMTIRRADHKSIIELAHEMQGRAERIRNLGDPDFKKMKSMLGRLPGILSKYVLNFAGFLMYTLNLWTPLLGSPRDPFGSCMITSIGSLGLDMAFAPLVPYSRVPLLIAVGAARETPVVKDGKLAIALISRFCVTIDHRLIDGMHASQMSKTLLAIFADPEQAFGPV
jgi:pyruvate/2-oxoglutarate dehydrogenase complex dihydrolipoamide acyltransferase (E2) component